FFGCSSQPEEKGMLKLEIIDNELKISRFEYQNFQIDTTKKYLVKVRYKLINTSSHDILLYNFRRNFELSELEPAFFCDSLYGSSEKMIYVFRKNGKQKMPAGRVPDSLNYKLEMY
ncbi:MAG: hypothetical protein ACKOE6_03310, partial [Flammeovirgaceae bacterium]